MLHTDSRPEIDRVEGRAIGYANGPNGLAPNTATMPWSGTSAGGGYSTVHDLLRFADALQKGKLLNRALLKVATTGDTMHPRYGLGFYVLSGGGFGHGGGAPGINGELHILPQNGYVLMALVNRDPRMARHGGRDRGDSSSATGQMNLPAKHARLDAQGSIFVHHLFQNSIRPRKAIIRGALSPPRPTPSNPVGGEIVLFKAPNRSRGMAAGDAGLLEGRAKLG